MYDCDLRSVELSFIGEEVGFADWAWASLVLMLLGAGTDVSANGAAAAVLALGGDAEGGGAVKGIDYVAVSLGVLRRWLRKSIHHLTSIPYTQQTHANQTLQADLAMNPTNVCLYGRSG